MKRPLIFAAGCLGWIWAASAGAQAPLPEPALTKDELIAVRAAEDARVKAIDSVYGSVVAIYGNDRGGGGSGVLYDPSGLAITNHHVVAGAGTDGWAGLADGRLYRWKLVGTDPGGDVAIIQLLGKDSFPIAPLGNSDHVRIGDFSMAMGNPFVLAEDQRPTVTLGVVSGVLRFQEGSGNNQLVYGNCIQVDSSINPGNSGGPLFNMQGEVIGINGRGSFKERGRVNVGLGYAISVNQVKNFIPDLLATKMVQHGTLDAIFGNREGSVMCYTINLDSALAKAGVQLGDKLVAFEGQPITNANQFTNLVSTFPAGWPCEVTYEHEGKTAIAHVRLIALPYGPKTPPPQPPKEEKKPEEKKPEDGKPEDKQPEDKQPADKPAEDKPAGKPAEKKPEEKPAEKKPDGAPMPMPMPMPIPMQPMKPPPNFGSAGFFSSLGG
jgi:S1-C subfamily serine protease